MTIINFFKNSPYFDRNIIATSIIVREITKEKDDTGRYIDTLVSETQESNAFITPVKRSLLNPEILEKYDEVNYVYLQNKLTLKSITNESILVIDGEIMKVLDYHGRFLDSGFYKYMVTGTGNNVV